MRQRKHSNCKHVLVIYDQNNVRNSAKNNVLFMLLGNTIDRSARVYICRRPIVRFSCSVVSVRFYVSVLYIAFVSLALCISLRKSLQHFYLQKSVLCICFFDTHSVSQHNYWSTLVRMQQLWIRFFFALFLLDSFCFSLVPAHWYTKRSKLHNRFSHVNEHRSELVLNTSLLQFDPKIK